MTEATVEDYATGQVAVPFEKLVIGGLELKQDAVRYAGMELELTVLNNRGRRPLGMGLQILAEVTRTLPIPASPLKEAGTYLLDYTNKVVDAEVEKQDPKDVARSAVITLEFDPSGKHCEGTTFEQTGTIAVLYAQGKPGHLVPLDKIDCYCWDAKLVPSFVLNAAPKAVNQDCKSIKQEDWFQVTNNYSALVR